MARGRREIETGTPFRVAVYLELLRGQSGRPNAFGHQPRRHSRCATPAGRVKAGSVWVECHLFQGTYHYRLSVCSSRVTLTQPPGLCAGAAARWCWEMRLCDTKDGQCRWGREDDEATHNCWWRLHCSSHPLPYLPLTNSTPSSGSPSRLLSATLDPPTPPRPAPAAHGVAATDAGCQ